ncbi:MAG: HAD family hydrolase [Candidatus Aminicenantes bacterium]|nr:HAD family hydrolase [Candidatus Aminicenantes bacterium]
MRTAMKAVPTIGISLGSRPFGRRLTCPERRSSKEACGYQFWERMEERNMKITTVLLDAGGIILDESEHEEVRAEITVEILSAIVPGYSISVYYSDIEEAVKCFCPGVYQYVFWNALNRDMPLFDKLYATYLSEWKNRKPPLKLTPGLESELRAISGDFNVGIAGQYGKELLDLLEQQSLLNCFTHRLTQDDFSTTKPDIRFYDQILKASGVEPQQCIMVGDRIDKDVIPAKLLGMKTILIRVGLHKNQQPRIPFEVPDADLENIFGLAQAVLKVAEE